MSSISVTLKERSKAFLYLLENNLKSGNFFFISFELGWFHCGKDSNNILKGDIVAGLQLVCPNKDFQNKPD